MRSILIVLLLLPSLALAQLPPLPTDNRSLMENFFSVYRATRSGTTKDAATLNQAITDLTGLNRCIYLTEGDWTLDANVTVPSALCLWVPRGSRFTGTGNLTINGPFLALRPQSEWWTSSGTLTLNATPIQIGNMALDAATISAPADYFQPFYGTATNGCIGTTSVDTTMPALACSAWTNTGTYVTQASNTITLSAGNGDYRIAVHNDTSSTVAGCGGGNWTREAGMHYIWCQATRPDLPSGTAGIMDVEVIGGAINVVRDIRHRIMSAHETITASMATAQGGAWTWHGPGAIITVAAGETLTFGACPQAGRWQIFDANESSTGAIRFAKGACGEVYPEWWGADPTGAVDSTAIWVDVLAAARGTTAIACEGEYAVSAGSGSIAIQLDDDDQIVGSWKRGNFAGTLSTTPCTFRCSGSGSICMGTTDTQPSYNNMRVEKVALIDASGTVAYGMFFHDPQSTTFSNIYTEGFDIGVQLQGNMYYNDLAEFRVDLFRIRGVEVLGPCNGCRLQFTAIRDSSAAPPTVLSGLRLSPSGTFFSTSSGTNIFASVEIRYGTPIVIQRQRGINGTFYVELPGNSTDYNAAGAVQISRVEGGRIHLGRIRCTAAGDGQEIDNCVYIITTNGGTERNTRNLLLTGHIEAITAASGMRCLRIDQGPGMFGINIDGLQVPTPACLAIGDFTVGHFLGQNYVTMGVGVPDVDEGRGDQPVSGSAPNEFEWQVGDIIWQRTGLTLRNTARVVTGKGNPPADTEMVWLPSVDHITWLNDTATVSAVSATNGNVYMGNILVQGGGPATPITDITGGIDGQILHLLWTGSRDLVHNASKIVLEMGVTFSGTSNDTMCLHLRGGIWYECGRSVNP
jgi:hypothetical protein